jgi:hypothetical protein
MARTKRTAALEIPFTNWRGQREQQLLKSPLRTGVGSGDDIDEEFLKIPLGNCRRSRHRQEVQAAPSLGGIATISGRCAGTGTITQEGAAVICSKIV